MWIARCSCGVEVRLANSFDRPDADCVQCLAVVSWRLYEVSEERGWKVHVVGTAWVSAMLTRAAAARLKRDHKALDEREVVVRNVVRRTLRRVG
jgi:hypothetical protein